MKEKIEHISQLIASVKMAQDILKEAIDAIAEDHKEEYSKAEIRAMAKICYEDSLEEERQKANELFDKYESIFGS